MSPCCRFHLCALLSWALLETYLFLSSFIVSTLLKCPHSGEICLIWMIFYVHLCVQENNHLDHFSTRRKGLSFAKDIISVGKINFSIDGWFGNAKQSQLVFRNLEQCEKTSKGIECTETLTTSFCVFPAEWDDPRSGRRGFLAGRPHPAGLQRRRTVLSGQPSDALHRLPQGRMCTLRIAAPVTTAKQQL